MKDKDTSFKIAQDGQITSQTDAQQKIAEVPFTSADADKVNFYLNWFDGFFNSFWNELKTLFAYYGIVFNEGVNNQLLGIFTGIETKAEAYQDGYIKNGVVTTVSITDIDISAIKCRSDDNTKNIDVSVLSGMDVTVNANWASGTAPSLTSATIHVFADYNSGTPRFILDDNSTGSNIVGGVKRRIASIITDSGDNIIQITVLELSGGGIEVEYTAGKIQVYALATGHVGTRGKTTTAASPIGIETQAKLYTEIYAGGSPSSGRILFTHPSSTDVAPTQTNCDFYFEATAAGTNDRVGSNIRPIVADSTDGKVYFRNTTTGPASTFAISQSGYIDNR